MAARHATSVCNAAVHPGARLHQAAGIQPSAGYPVLGLHPLRLLSTVVQEQLAIAQTQGANTDNHDSFVGSDLHRKLSKPHAYADPEAQVLQQGSAEWHHARRQRVTASSVARATGLLPMCAPWTLFVVCAIPSRFMLLFMILLVGVPSEQHIRMCMGSAETLLCTCTVARNELTRRILKLLYIHAVACRFSKSSGGLDPPQRTQLWMEMLGLMPRFQGNRATYWGTQNEGRAIQKFTMHMNQNTSHLYLCSFDVLQDLDKHGRMLSWVGASPDGLIVPASHAGGLQQENSDIQPVPHPLLDVHDRRTKGVLEVKCPFNLRNSVPYKAWPQYYLPQVLTNMAVFDAQYAYMACWTPQGLSLFHVEKHPAFWDGVRPLRDIVRVLKVSQEFMTTAYFLREFRMQRILPLAVPISCVLLDSMAFVTQLVGNETAYMFFRLFTFVCGALIDVGNECLSCPS